MYITVCFELAVTWLTSLINRPVCLCVVFGCAVALSVCMCFISCPSRSLWTALWVSCAVLCVPPGDACRGTSVPTERESAREKRTRTAVYNTGLSDRNHAAEEKVTPFFFSPCLVAPPRCFNWLTQLKRTDCNLCHAFLAHQSTAEIGGSAKTAAQHLSAHFCKASNSRNQYNLKIANNHRSICKRFKISLILVKVQRWCFLGMKQTDFVSEKCKGHVRLSTININLILWSLIGNC